MQPTPLPSIQTERSFIEAARRAQIVNAAIDVIADVGYARASFARIAARAGISPGLISYHFANKGDLMSEVVRAVSSDMEQAVGLGVENAEGYLGALRALIENYVSYCVDHLPQLVAVGQIEESEGWGASERESSVSEFEALLQGGQEQGEFRAFAPRVMAVALLAALEATPVELLAHPDTDARVYADELSTAFELAVRKPSLGGS